MRHTALQFSSQLCAWHGFSQRHGATEIKRTLDSAAAAGNTALRFPPCLCDSVREIVKHLLDTTPTESQAGFAGCEDVAAISLATERNGPA